MTHSCENHALITHSPKALYARSVAWWWARQDSNLQPDGYEPSALTIELQAHLGEAGYSILAKRAIGLL